MRTAKAFYIALLGIFTLLALLLRYNGDDLGIDLGAWNVHCSSKNDMHSLAPGITWNDYKITEDKDYYIYCKGDAAVYRISFVLASFFGIMTVLSFFDRGQTTRGFWAVKLFGLFFGLLICLFVSNSFFDNSGYAWVARIGSVGFLLLQILILIDFAYQMNDYMVEMAFPEDGGESKTWIFIILGSAALLYLGCMVAIPLLFTYFGECAVGVVFSSLTMIGMIIFTALTLFRDRIVGVEGAILPAAVVAVYCTFLAWSSLSANPDPVCVPQRSPDDQGHHLLNLVVGIIVAIGSLMWTSLSVTESIESLVTGSEESSKSDAATPLYTVAGEDGREEQVEAQTYETSMDFNDATTTENIWVFHLVMMTASMYMAMLLTDWGANKDAHGNENGGIGVATMWVKIVSQWLTIALYIWTLVAPRVLGDYRDFD